MGMTVGLKLFELRINCWPLIKENLMDSQLWSALITRRLRHLSNDMMWAIYVIPPTYMKAYRMQGNGLQRRRPWRRRDVLAAKINNLQLIMPIEGCRAFACLAVICRQNIPSRGTQTPNAYDAIGLVATEPRMLNSSLINWRQCTTRTNGINSGLFEFFFD